jgi:4-hydroxy-tetrahydrodipicolinate synthase
MITKDQAKQRFQGVCVPIITIYKEDGSLDLDGLASNVQWMIDQGARQGNTIFLAAGSGGDFTVLNVEERKQVIKTVAEVSAGRVPTMAGVQSTDIRTVIELCQYAERVGIELAQISGAYYYDPKPDDVMAWHEEVARHTGIGFSAYSHWYSGSKYDVPVDLIERLLDIPNTVAVKWASPSVGHFVEGMRRFVPRVAVVNNGAALAVYSHILGARSWVSHVVNFFPEFCWRVHSLMEEERYQEAHRVYSEFMGAYAKLRTAVQSSTAGEGIFVKPGMEAAGLVAGRSRLPSRDEAVPAEVREGFVKLLDSARAAVAA